MSRAFVKESDQDELPPVPPPALPPGVPNHITPAGAAAFRAEQQALLSERAALRSQPDALARGRLATVQARLRWLDARAPTWVETPASALPAQACFGCTVQLLDEQGDPRTLTLVGVDEVDVAAGRVSFLSPVARALIGAAVGDTVTLRGPQGEEQWTVVGLASA
jgi:transcription elongation factor GreB